MPRRDVCRPSDLGDPGSGSGDGPGTGGVATDGCAQE